MHKLSPKENMLRLITFKDPEYIPYDLESVKRFTHRDGLFYRGNGDPSAVEWTDAWGVKFKLSDIGFKDSAYPVYHPLMTLEGLDEFPFPDPSDPELFTAVQKQMEAVDRKNNLVMLVNPGFMFVRAWLLHGMEETFIDIVTEPKLYEALLDKIYAYQETVIKRSIELKPDIIHFGDDAGTTKALMINPTLWRSMIKPRLKRICDICKDAGCIVLMHCCGCVQDIVDDIIEIGVDILDPLQAGANDLSYIKSRARGRLTLHGGIDSHTVATADPPTVAELTRNVLRLLGDGGGYIAYTDNVLPFPKENIEAIRAVVNKEGTLS